MVKNIKINLDIDQKFNHEKHIDIELKSYYQKEAWKISKKT